MTTWQAMQIGSAVGFYLIALVAYLRATDNRGYPFRRGDETAEEFRERIG